MRDKLKGYRISFSIFLFLFLCFFYPIREVFSTEGFSDYEQSIEFGISYLSLEKSFINFPLAWKTTMPLASLNYELNIGKFLLGFRFGYGKSTYIKVNDAKRWGRNNFSILGFKYDFLWCNSNHGKKQRFLLGLGASLENIEIDQKIEISPKKYNRYEDRYLGIGPKMELSWSLSRSDFGLSLASTVTLPCASTGTLLSDDAFSDKAYLTWVKITASLFYQYIISHDYELSFQLDREALAYGRSYKMTYDRGKVYPYGSFLMRSLRVGLKHRF
jgi:hypothetical protein